MSVSANLSGIGSILGSDCEVSSKTPASLRRTLSADMSSMKWMREQGFSLLRKVASSEQLKTLSEIDPSDDKMKKAEDSDLWSSIMSCQKSLPSSTLSPPYVHPLTKRSRSLSQKSLEICTENLGSETGSDGFSSYSSSESSDEEPDHEEIAVGEKEIIGELDQEEIAVGEKEMVRKKACTRSFPPPIPSLSLQMKSRRQDGRLVLEAMPAAAHSQSCFQAQRTNGRLLLTFLDSSAEEVEENNEKAQNNVEEISEIDMYEEPKRERFKDKDDIEDEEDQEIEDMVDEEKIEMEIKEKKLFSMEVDEPRRNLPTGAMNVHRTLMVNKLTNRNSTSNRSNKFDTKDKEVTILPQSLPPVPRMTGFLPASAATSFNTYDYFWRNWSAQSPTPTPNLTKNKVFSSNNINPHEEQKKLILSRSNKADYSLVPSSRGCKEARRSLLIPEPHCIATS